MLSNPSIHFMPHAIRSNALESCRFPPNQRTGGVTVQVECGVISRSQPNNRSNGLLVTPCPFVHERRDDGDVGVVTTAVVIPDYGRVQAVMGRSAAGHPKAAGAGVRERRLLEISA